MKKLILAFSIVAIGNTTMAASPAAIVREGNQAYKDQLFDIAKEKYDSITDQEKLTTGHINYDKANCLFKQGDYDGAIELYRKAANQSSDNKLTASTKFNLGNCYFQKAKASQQEQPEEAVKDYLQSARCYRQALDIDKNDIEAAQNIALSRKKIKELKEILKQQQQQQNQDQDNKDENKQDQQDQQDKQNQSGQQNKDQKQDKQQNNDQQQDSQQQSGDNSDQQQNSQQKDQQEQEQSQEQQQQQAQEEKQQQEAQQQNAQKEDKEQKQAAQKVEVDPKAAQIIEDENKRKEQKVRLMRIQQKPAQKDW